MNILQKGLTALTLVLSLATQPVQKVEAQHFH